VDRLESPAVASHPLRLGRRRDYRVEDNAIHLARELRDITVREQ
jgi:hypothetical protein